MFGLNKELFLVVVPIILNSFESCYGHGYVLDPIARGSRWRFNTSALPNYNDNALFCGGFYTQWYENEGECGLCGDDFANPKPRLHELGGVYGEGVIVENYTQGEVITVIVRITANHRGYFEFRICNLDINEKESDSCFEQYQVLTEDGSPKYDLPSQATKNFPFNLSLPDDLVCDHCVLQWTYTTANSWGICNEANGVGALGCGIQENFRTCSDIAIFPKQLEVDDKNEMNEVIDNEIPDA